MSENTIAPVKDKRFNPTTAVLLILPLVMLIGIILLFLSTSGGLKLTAPVPVEDLTIERMILKPGMIEIYVRNSSRDDVKIAQAVINSAVWPIVVSPSPTIPRLQDAQIRFEYDWSYGEAYSIRLFTSNSIPFDIEIPVAFETAVPDGHTFLSFTLIGLYVGVIPVFLGLFWFPALRQLKRKWMMFLLAITAGLLVFLGMNTLAEAIDQASLVPGPFQGIGLIVIGVLGTFLLLYTISKRQVNMEKSEAAQRLALAYMIAVSIGLHNLGEGLAIGAAYNTGKVVLGEFLVVGFILQNISEGLGIIAPVLRDRLSWLQLTLMGIVGGAPAILGAWIGAFSPSPTLAVLFLAVGTGAVFVVVYEVAKLIQKDTARQPMPVTVFSGILTGMLLLWVTGLLVK